ICNTRNALPRAGWEPSATHLVCSQYLFRRAALNRGQPPQVLCRGLDQNRLPGPRRHSGVSEVNNVELLSGAEMVVRFLRDEGVKYIYGYPGGALLHIYDALFQEKEVTHILVRHEQAATHMADGYARATGSAAVVLVASGPAATDPRTGSSTAYVDSIPTVSISGQVPCSMVGTDAFHETVMIAISRPIAKLSFMIRPRSEIPEV